MFRFNLRMQLGNTLPFVRLLCFLIMYTHVQFVHFDARLLQFGCAQILYAYLASTSTFTVHTISLSNG